MAPGIIDSTKKDDSDVPKHNDSEFDDVPQTDPDGAKKKKKKKRVQSTEENNNHGESRNDLIWADWLKSLIPSNQTVKKGQEKEEMNKINEKNTARLI